MATDEELMEEFAETNQYQGEIKDWNDVDATYDDPDE